MCLQETDGIDTGLGQFPLFWSHCREMEVHWSLISWQPLNYNHLQFIDKCSLLSKTVSHDKPSANSTGNPNQYSVCDRQSWNMAAFPNWEWMRQTWLNLSSHCARHRKYDTITKSFLKKFKYFIHDRSTTQPSCLLKKVLLYYIIHSLKREV